MIVDIEIIYNYDKGNYTILNLSNYTKDSIQSSAARKLAFLLPIPIKYFNTQEDTNIYVDNLKNKLKGNE